MRPASASWITPRRLRARGLVLALCLWFVYLWNITTPGLLDRSGNLKGTDFLHFYTLGSLALAHRGADLYNMRAQSELVAQRVPAAAAIRYLPLYPPQVSIFFAPLAQFSYPWALAIWLTLSALIYGGCCYAVWRLCPNLQNYGTTVLILAVAYPAFWHLIAWGQTSALALACFTIALIALRKRREVLCGLALGSLIFKPQLGLAAAVIFVITLRWRVIAGALLASGAQMATGSLYFGLGPLRAWAQALRNTPKELALLEPRLYQTHSLRTFWAMLIPWPQLSFSLYVATALIVCTLAVGCWRSPMPLSLRFSALLFATALLAPHLTVYDLVILAPAFLLLSDWLVRQRGNEDATLKLLMYLAFVLPLIGPLAYWTHFQLSVPVMAALLFLSWKIGRKKIGRKMGPGQMGSEAVSIAEQEL